MVTSVGIEKILLVLRYEEDFKLEMYKQEGAVLFYLDIKVVNFFPDQVFSVEGTCVQFGCTNLAEDLSSFTMKTYLWHCSLSMDPLLCVTVPAVMRHFYSSPCIRFQAHSQ